MADLLLPERKKSRKSLSRKGIHVDLTPMVDLAFLLITFFMLVTSFSKPNVMDLALPGDSTDKPKEIDYRNQLTFILGDNDRVYYYQKELKELVASDFKSTSFAGVEIAKLISSYKKSAPKPDYFTVIVKPSEGSSYKNFVDMMDEISISKNERYGVTEMKPAEEKIYAQLSVK